MKLIEEVESVIKRMRWKAHFYLKGENEEENDDGNKKMPTTMQRIGKFRERPLRNCQKHKFRTIKDNFQGKLKRDIKAIRESPDASQTKPAVYTN